MKKVVLLIISSVCLFAAHAGQRTRTVSVQFPETEFCMETIGGLSAITAMEHVYTYRTDTLSPKLPHLAIQVLLAPDELVIGYSCSFSDSTSLGSVVMEACQLPMTSNTVYVLPQSAATQSDFRNVEFMGQEIIRGYRIACFEVSPFTYDSASGLLRLSQSLEINLALNVDSSHGSQSPSAETQAWACDTTRQWLGNLVCNPDDVATFYAAPDINAVPPADRYEYLIITNATLKPEFQRLADWKNTKGVRTKLMTTEEIYENFPDITHQRQIKRAIMDLSAKTKGALQYVLLGGDETVVPTQMVHIEQVDANDSLYSKNTPCDLYYSNLAEQDWDKNGNGIIGEVADSVSLSSDLVVSRIPASDVTKANIQINRIIDYEKQQPSSPWLGKILLVARKWYRIYQPDSISDAHRRSDIMCNRSIKPYWSGGIFRFYDTGSDFPENAAYDVTAEHLQTELSKGYTFVHVETHGDYRAWRMEHNNPSYYTGNAKRLNNVGHTVILTSACSTCEFDTTEITLAEHFLQNPNSGILAYLGSSKESWSGSSTDFNGLIFKSLLTDKEHRLAQAVRDAKNLTNYVNRYTPSRWIVLNFNAFGDAEMPVYVEKPRKFGDIELEWSNGKLVVNHEVDSCMVCVMSLEDEGQTYYNVKKSVNNTETVFSDLQTGSYSVCVTKPGYVPYVAQVHQLYYLQDETIAAGEQRNVLAGKVAIGRHVTDDKPQGEVVINGNLTVKSAEPVLIDRGTTVNKGAYFEVKSNK